MPKSIQKIDEKPVTWEEYIANTNYVLLLLDMTINVVAKASDFKFTFFKFYQFLPILEIGEKYNSKI